MRIFSLPFYCVVIFIVPYKCAVLVNFCGSLYEISFFLKS
ncbi:hypothetical protein HMPREF1246_1034 [Acidaminococcus sp. BV3L6]|nr:hypothetical protein HMPREF1246_1034 [Acidaminococcus sp. BV3L6]